MANVVLPFDGDFDALRRKLVAWGFEVGERPNAPLFAQGHGVTLHAYRTGKLLLTGARAEEWAGQLRGEVAPRAALARPSAPAPAARGWVMHFDGACEPKNPGGVAAWGYHVERDGARVKEDCGVAAAPGPGATNNVAEFHGLLWGLRWLEAQGAREPLVLGDSKLVVDIVNRRRAVLAPHLKPLAEEARRLAERLGARVEWVPREENAGADWLTRVGYERAVRAHPEWGFPSKYALDARKGPGSQGP